MPVIKVRENEPFDRSTASLRRSNVHARKQVLAEVRRREFYEKPD